MSSPPLDMIRLPDTFGLLQLRVSVGHVWMCGSVDRREIPRNGVILSKEISFASDAIEKMLGCAQQGSFSSCKGEASTVAVRGRFGLPSTELLLAKYHCALRSNTLSLSQGRLYVFPRHVAFACDVIGHVQSILVRLSDVAQVKKAKTLLLLPNAIEIRLIDGTNYFLTSFLSRNEAYHQIRDLWSISKGIELARCVERSIDINDSKKLNSTKNDEPHKLHIPRCFTPFPFIPYLSVTLLTSVAVHGDRHRC